MYTDFRFAGERRRTGTVVAGSYCFGVSAEQEAMLQAAFRKHPYPNRDDVEALAEDSGLPDYKVRGW